VTKSKNQKLRRSQPSIDSSSSQKLLIHHLLELRARIIWPVAILIIGSGIAYFYRNFIVAVVADPLHQQLIYNSPSGGLQFILQICLGVGVIASLPFFLYNIWRFIEPAFSSLRHRRRSGFWIITSSILLATAGVCFGYFVVLPISLKFFASFNIGPIKSMISTSEYLSFMIGCIVTFAIIFQLPLLLLLINKISPFPPGSLRRHQKHVIIGSLFLGLILPFTYDPITQFVVALPVIVLYEISVILITISNRGKRKAVTKVAVVRPAQSVEELIARPMAVKAKPAARRKAKAPGVDARMPTIVTAKPRAIRPRPRKLVWLG
jgi:sec-independent protein translocase protein TatC